jgi:nitrite reductase (NADH) large subunit
VALAAQAGLPVERGIVVDDALRVHGHDGIHAIGECAQHRGTTYGLVAPAWEQAAVVADRITGADDEVIRFSEPARRVYKSAIVRDGRLAGAILLGDVGKAPALSHALSAGTPQPSNRAALFFDLRDGAPSPTVAELGPDARICDCNNVSKGEIEAAMADGCESLSDVCAATRAGTGCGSCRKRIVDLIACGTPLPA